MTGFRKVVADYEDKKSNVKVELGDDSTYSIRVGLDFFHLDSSTIIHIDEILYVPRLKKNLLSVAVLQGKGFTIVFLEEKALMWPKDGNISSAIVIGVHEGNLYKVLGHVVQELVHESINPCERWYKREVESHKLDDPC